MRGMQSSEKAYLWSHPGGLSRQGPILPGEGETGQACPDLHSRAESAPSPWKLCLAHWEGRTSSSGNLSDFKYMLCRGV